MNPEPPSLPTSPVEDTCATLSQRSLFDPSRVKTPEPGADPRISISVFTDSESGPTPASGVNAAREGGMGGLQPSASPAFVLTRVVGHGGHGEVHEAIQTSLGRPVAVKRIREEVYRRHTPGSHEVLLVESDFRQEALLTGVLEHPNIVPVHDFGRDDRGRPLMAMKLLRGKRWDALVKEDWESGLDANLYHQKHLQILRDVAQAVAFAHSKGVVHRDIKPSQVMVGEFGETVLMDWGLAVFVGDSAESFSLAQHALMQLLPTRENASNPAGTPAFMAPEQTRRSANDIGPATDVFLLGASLYFLLTGTAPYTSAMVSAAMERASRCDFEPPQVRARDREIPTELAQLCIHAMQRVPADRVPSARAFVEAIEAYFSDAGKRSRSVALVEAVRRDLQGGGGDYRTLAEMVSNLNQAQGLWPENDEVRPLLDDVRESYAAFALREGDLKLAAAQCAMIGDEERRKAVEARAVPASGAVAARARVLRFLEGSAAVMAWLVILAAAGIVARESLAGDRGDRGASPDVLIQDLRYLDEAITMSGLMAVESREPAWWLRRRELSEKMNATFAVLAGTRFGQEETAALELTAAANRAVREMGSQAMEADESGDADKAREILHSDAYGAAKAALDASIRELGASAHKARIQNVHWRMLGLIPTYVLLLAIAFYVLAFRRLRRTVPSEAESKAQTP